MNPSAIGPTGKVDYRDSFEFQAQKERPLARNSVAKKVKRSHADTNPGNSQVQSSRIRYPQTLFSNPQQLLLPLRQTLPDALPVERFVQPSPEQEHSHEDSMPSPYPKKMDLR